jgi:hypothetical protein
MNNVINIQKGNAYSAELLFSDKRETVRVPYDLTGKTISFTVKNPSDNSNNDNKALIKKDWNSHTDASKGISRLDLKRQETNIPTGNYLYDFKINGINTQAGDLIVTSVITTR